MYRLLIVDDEPDIVEGLYNAFYDYEGLELDIFRAYSAYDAIKILNSERIDIVLSDIRMPGMDGLEMTRLVKERWPECQVIFLSAYPEFDYIYEANQLGAVNYILKTEGYEKIAESLHSAVNRIQKEAKLSQPYRSGLEFSHKFVDFILGEQTVKPEDLDHILSNMNIPMSSEIPVYMMLGRFSHSNDMDFRQRSELYSVLNEMTCRYILPRYNVILDEREPNTFVMILQPHDSHRSRAASADLPSPVTEMKGLAEMMQNGFSEESNVVMSFIIYDETVYMKDLGYYYRRIENMLKDSEIHGMGLIVLDKETISSPHNSRMQYSMSTSHAIELVKEYIKENLGRPISLTSLANEVYYNASYLSRLFKKSTGMNLTGYITAMRMEKAKELLINTNKRIAAIADELCFASPSYFNQAFKKHTGMTPLEFRTKCR
ncbi:MAG: response regulator [Clostridiales bacterium]|jgi:two-component system response regulator YesN|nr:response regulator [Clostridiales bacterium]